MKHKIVKDDWNHYGHGVYNDKFELWFWTNCLDIAFYSKYLVVELEKTRKKYIHYHTYLFSANITINHDKSESEYSISISITLLNVTLSIVIGKGIKEFPSWMVQYEN
jgi:hypothetical protein